ncbi:MAG: D-Ala-D-Ala carboxypeptidase family metallohydrolase [Candidatus Korobacteraceae bacterium]
MKAFWHEFFSDAELACRCGCGEQQMKDAFLRRLVDLRIELDFAFIVSSAYRCPRHNQAVATTGSDGPHTTGRAVDLLVYGFRAMAILEAAARFGMTGIGLRQHGPHRSRFLHLDDLPAAPGRPRPWVWTYCPPA